ncbi:hypothetical protein C1646_758608 [Rhizophagus diaphanus]|nr:hypothetical protein C1646_758608 [Rhizophagus diaphanus] [Rhizophagus sp. MUCL 43196]
MVKLSEKWSAKMNDLISVSENKQQTQDITNLQNICSIKKVSLELDISFEKIPLEDREYKKKNHSQSLIQELLIESSEEDCIKVVNMEKNSRRPFKRLGGLLKNGKTKFRLAVQIQPFRFSYSGGLLKNGKTKFYLTIRVGFRSIEILKIRSGRLPNSEEQKTKICLGGLPNSEERKRTKIRSGGLLKNEKELRFDGSLEFSSPSFQFPYPG